MINVTLRHGLSREVKVDLQEPVTIRSLIGNPNYRAILALPENVVAVIDGETVSLDTELCDGDVVQFERQAAAKA